ncbi:MAG: DegT/DnrJ/EryC1/StrS family aminotransferase, partial [Flavobacterium stagni]
GGALVTGNQATKEKIVFLATQARDVAPHYQHSAIGYNYRLSNICAGIGRGQMEVLDKHIQLRREMHAFYNELFKENDGITLFTEPNSEYFSNHWLSAITVNSEVRNGITSEQLRLRFEAENIESRPLWKPMHLQPVFEGLPYYGGNVAENLFLNGLCLPSGSNLSDSDRERIAAVINSI